MPTEHVAETALPPSPWVLRFAPLIAPGADVLDVACGGGRHLRALTGRGWQLHGVDRDDTAFDALRPLAELTRADLEGAPWPFPARTFGGIVVANYLWRPLLPTLMNALAPGGVLIYETFARGNELLGRPRNPEFLLRPGELLDAVRGRLRVVAYEDGYVEQPRPAFVQRLCAVREAGNGGHPPAKYNL